MAKKQTKAHKAKASNGKGKKAGAKKPANDLQAAPANGKKAQRKKTGPIKRKRCSTKDCRKTVIISSGNDYCTHCMHEKHIAAFPLDGVARMTPLQAMTIEKMEADMQNAVQATRVIDLEIEQLKRDLNERIASKFGERAMVVSQEKGRRSRYDQLIAEIAAEHEIPLERFSFDTENLVLYDELTAPPPNAQKLKETVVQKTAVT